ncbi:beta-galactosidase [Breznakibacter xylanolyticus]|uniref:Beta-galactosidase n=1 Tax=Breznakibacter xylanolyticus TaxID=990 RepID=A0A2W7N9S3_9BACT|nr:beta-galactosidase [Breznakibacter xylanolyticus]PZX16403.1 beta-galactosidase [Breznakibacter xylanolyticus]
MNRIVLLLATLLWGNLLIAQNNNTFFPKKDLMTIGVYYYPEHWNESQWERDIQNIADMGFEFIHLGEFAWIDMEPEEGHFQFEWLDRVIDLAQKHQLKVILCTPSITPPVWLGEKHPEIYLMNANYIRQEHGTRAMNSLTNDIYRQYCATIVTQLAQRYGQHKAVIGWQIDNEPEAKHDFSPSAQAAFRTWLEKQYGTIDKLNAAWGTAFWSQRYSRFDQVKIPNAQMVGWWGTNPHALLDFQRFSADVQGEFLDIQAEILRGHIAPTQFVTTNYLGTGTGADPRRASKLDLAAFTAYPNYGSTNLGEQGFRMGDPLTLSFANDYYRSVKGITGVMELQPGQVNWANINAQLLPGTTRMWLYHCFGAGASFACTYRYRQINYSAEQYHSGIVKTDGITPSLGGREFEQAIKEMKTLRKLARTNTPLPKQLQARKTAMLWNNDNIWSMQRQSQSVQWNAMSHFQKYHEMAKSLGAPTDIVSENDDWSAYRVMIAPAYELLDTMLVEKWRHYVHNGGHLVLTPRTGVKNRHGHIWESDWAAPIYPLINAKIDFFDQMHPSGKGEINMANRSYTWNNWADVLTPNHPQSVVASYSNQFYADKAAVVTHTIGKGTITYIGVDTDDNQLEREVVKQVYQRAGATTEEYPAGVYVQWRDGLWTAVNYSSETQLIDIPQNAKIVIGESNLAPAGVVVWME